MKELAGNARNDFFVVAEDGALIPSAEIIIMLSQPSFAFAPGGGLNRTREMSECRFCAHPEGLRGLAKFLSDAADDLDENKAKFDKAIALAEKAEVES